MGGKEQFFVLSAPIWSNLNDSTMAKTTLTLFKWTARITVRCTIRNGISSLVKTGVM